MCACNLGQTLHDVGQCLRLFPGSTSCRYVRLCSSSTTPTNHLHVTRCAAMCPSPTPPQHVTHPFSHRTKVANSNNDSFGIHSVKVLVQVHYFVFSIKKLFPFLKVGAHRVPTSPKGIRGPEGARIKENSRSGTERICVHLHAHACPEGAIISRSGTERNKWNRAKYV